MRTNGLFIFVLCVTLALCDELLEKPECPWECAVSSGVSAKTLKNVSKGQLDDDENLKKFLFCFYKKAGFMKENGDYDAEVIRRKMATPLGDNVEVAIAACTKFTGTSEQKAFEYAKCIPKYF